MDVLYYSNYCKHCKKLLQYLAKNGLQNSMNCLCIDKRVKNQYTGQTFIVTERGAQILLPPNIQRVPSLLLVKNQYNIIIGDEIYNHFTPKVSHQNNLATGNNGEPFGYLFGSIPNFMNVVSEQYTYYNMSPDELSSKGRGGMRQMHNYVSAAHDYLNIPTPDETYKSDKIGNVSMETLQQQRNEEIVKLAPPPNAGVDALPNGYSPPIYTPQGPPAGGIPKSPFPDPIKTRG